MICHTYKKFVFDTRASNIQQNNKMPPPAFCCCQFFLWNISDMKRKFYRKELCFFVNLEKKAKLSWNFLEMLPHFLTEQYGNNFILEQYFKQLKAILAQYWARIQFVLLVTGVFTCESIFSSQCGTTQVFKMI